MVAKITKSICFGITFFMLMAISTPSFAADITLRWDPATGATGYKVFNSLDNGQTWSAGTDVGNVTEIIVSAPETGLVLYRVSAYNSVGEIVNSWAGAWYNHLWKPPEAVTGARIQ